MTCGEARELISRFLDDDLDASLRAGMEEHLDRCPECAEARDAILLGQEALRSLAYPDPPEPYWEELAGKMADRMAAEGEGSVPVAPLHRPGRIRNAVAMAFVAGLAAASVLALFALHPMWEEKEFAPPTLENDETGESTAAVAPAASAALKVDLAGTDTADDTFYVMLDAAHEKVLRIAELAEKRQEAEIPALVDSYCRLVSQSLLALDRGNEGAGGRGNRAWRRACRTHADVLTRTLAAVSGEAQISVRKAIELCENQ